MLEKIRYSVRFNRNNRLRADGTSLIQIEAYLHGRRTLFSTNIHVRPDQWRAGFIVNHPQADQLNEYVYRSVLDMQAVELEHIRRGRRMSLRALRNAVTAGTQPQASLREVTEAIVATSPNRGRRTREAYLTMARAVDGYDPGVRMDEVDAAWLDRYADHMRRQGYGHNTVVGRLRCIRAMYNEAVRRRLVIPTENAFDGYRIPAMRHRDGFLTLTEVAQVAALRLEGRAAHVRDAFLMACYTGLRFSDLTALTAADIRHIAGNPWIEKRMAKTGLTVSIPIYAIFGGEAVRLIGEYGTVERLVAVGCNASANRTLREEVIARTAIAPDRHVTFHTARHSCASNLLEQGVPVTTVQRILGHAKLEDTMIYAKATRAVVGKEIERAFRKRKGK